jgi:hypothetical protein
MVVMRALVTLYGPAIAITVLLAGCDLIFSVDHIDRVDASIARDVTPDATCLGVGLLNLCAEGGGQVGITTAINTTIDGRCRKVPQDNGPPLCVIDGERIAVSEYVQVTGESPLVLLATSTIEITAQLDVSSRATRIGAAAQLGCASGVGTNGSAGGGGGGGGTYGFIGGGGGAGQLGMFTTSPGGSPSPVLPQVAIYGGCAGGAGGIVTGTRAAGGAGGGAVYMIARDRIFVSSTGSINASGAGGRGAPIRGGGGGGGAGGFIALDAPMIMIDGAVFARGGGGGGGGGTTTAGGAGTDPMPTTQTPGGVAGSTGGTSGGDGCGAPNGMQGGITSSATTGGGGGGGGCGRIRVYGQRSGSGVTNPAPT